MVDVDELLDPITLVNLLTLALAAFALVKARRENRRSWPAMVVTIGAGLHFLFDLFADLGEHGEHWLTHVTLLGVAVVALMA